MLILSLDTSSPAGSFALLRDANVLSERVSTDHEHYSASVLREARELLDGAHISLEQIDLFAVDAGPGSFTGLRVGLTTVKGWAEVLGKARRGRERTRGFCGAGLAITRGRAH